MKINKEFWERVKKDFPNDPALQEVHYARLMIHAQTQEMSDEEFIEFIKKKAKKLMSENLTERFHG